MSHATTLSVRPVLALVLAAALGCSSSDLLLPDSPGSGSVALSILAGDEQTGTVGEPLPNPLMVQVLTERQQPAVGLQVEFLVGDDPNAGTVSPEVATTNSSGQALAHWTLGITPGSHVLVAHVVGGETDNQTAEFRAAARAAAPDTLSPQSALSQPGRRDREVDSQPTVRVVDRYGNPVESTPVTWMITAGDGTVSDPTTLTDANGTASVHWTLGGRIGIQQLSASVGSVIGSPVTFSATVLF